MKATSINSIEQLFNLTNKNQITLQSLLNKRLYINGLWWNNVEYSEELLEQLADIIAKGLYKGKEAREEIKYGILNGLGDTSYLQCIYLEKYGDLICIGNSLRGVAYQFCRRRFKKSIQSIKPTTRTYYTLMLDNCKELAEKLYTNF